jgi:hypothetical protein
MKGIVQCVERFKALYDNPSKDFEDGVKKEMIWSSSFIRVFVMRFFFVVSSFFLYYDLSRVRPQPRQLLKPRLHKTYLTIRLTLKKSTIISRFVMNYKLNFKNYVMFMIFHYVDNNNNNNNNMRVP